MQTKTKEEKQELLQLYRQSGMSVRAFAEEFELNLGTFRNWLYKKPAKNIPADDGCSLVEVEALKVKQCMDSQNIRIRKNGTEILILISIGLPVIEKILGALTAV